MKQITTALLAVWVGFVCAHAQTVSTFTGSNTTIDDDIIFDAAGNFYGSNYEGSRIFKRTPDGQESIFATGINSPNGLAFYDDGSMVVADNTGNKIYKITPAGNKTVLVPSIGGPSGILRIPNTDTMLVTSYTAHTVWKMSSDGIMSVYLTHPQFNGPVGMCYDDNHNLYVANFGDRKIFKVTPDGQISFLTQPPLGQYIGFIAYRNGFIYATAFNAHKIYKIDLAGNYAVWLGSTLGNTNGDATMAKFNQPNGIRFSPGGDTLFISEFGAKRVRIVEHLDGVSGTNDALMPEWNLVVAPTQLLDMANITFELQEASVISIGLYNLQGQLLDTVLENEKCTPGTHQFSLRNNGLSPGIYFLQMQSANGHLLAKKIVVPE